MDSIQKFSRGVSGLRRQYLFRPLHRCHSHMTPRGLWSLTARSCYRFGCTAMHHIHRRKTSVHMKYVLTTHPPGLGLRLISLLNISMNANNNTITNTYCYRYTSARDISKIKKATNTQVEASEKKEMLNSKALAIHENSMKHWT